MISQDREIEMKIQRRTPRSTVFIRYGIVALTMICGTCCLSGICSVFTQGIWTAEAHAQEVGVLHVTITPQEAIDAGAQWRVDGGTWRDSGVLLVGLEAGIYTVEFKGISEWVAPDNMPVTIVSDEVTEATGAYTYTPIRSLRVFVTPIGAIDAGAQWNVDGGPWQDSGTTVPDLSLGEHIVNYKDVFGWSTPARETVAVVAGQVTETTGTYTQLLGSLQPSITPQSVINEGAQWRVDDGYWQDTGTIISDLTLGSHPVIYKGVFGWMRPPDETVTVYDGQITVTAGDYTQITTGVTLRVPSDYTTIQAAINAASDGDTVLVADGTYVGLWNKDLDFNGKAIKIASENGPDNCIIDCEESGRGFSFQSDERQDSVIAGLTITRGKQGISCGSSSPTIIDCIISDNHDRSGYGGGIYSSASPIITNCTVMGNTSVCIPPQGVLFHRIVIDPNMDPTIWYGGSGGGICLLGSEGSPVISGCVVRDNVAYSSDWSDGMGGGIFACNGAVIIDKCTIWNNSAGGILVGVGGGINIETGSITNCIVFGNTAREGAAINCSAAAITNCTISDNTCQQYENGSVIACDPQTQITNSIIWNIGYLYVINGTPIIAFSDVKGGYAGDGNINADPMFVDPDKGDYRLREESPCIDTGTSAGAPATDIEGKPRPQGAGFDMGAYEFGKDIVYVSQDGVCYGNTPCYSTLQEGIDWDGVVFAIRAHEGPFPESIVLDEDKEITFQSGWDTTFTTDIGGTQITSMTIGNGTISIDRNCLVIGGN
jgi:hypothetical protein